MFWCWEEISISKTTALFERITQNQEHMFVGLIRLWHNFKQLIFFFIFYKVLKVKEKYIFFLIQIQFSLVRQMHRKTGGNNQIMENEYPPREVSKHFKKYKNYIQSFNWIYFCFPTKICCLFLYLFINAIIFIINVAMQ